MSWLDDLLSLVGDTAGGVGDFLGGAVDWSGGLDPTDWGSIAFDTDTGQFVDLGQSFGGVPDAVAGAGSGIVGDAPNGIPFTGSLDTSPASTSISDMIRSTEGADPGTTTPGAEPFDWNAMADPAASIASAPGTSGWEQAIAQGIKGLLSGIGPNLAKLATPSGGGLGPAPAVAGLSNAPSYGVPSVMTSGTPAVPLSGVPAAPGALPSVPSTQVGAGAGNVPLTMQSPIGAALSRLLAEAPGRVPLQAPIDQGPTPVAFTPLTMMPPAASAPPAAPLPRLSGLQALLAERRG